MATRRGPIQDESGTYYEVTGDDGRTRREYVNTSPEATSTTISANGDIIQPSPDAIAAQPAISGSTAGETEETSSRRSDGGTARTNESAGPRAPISSGRPSTGYSPPGRPSYGAPSLPTTRPAAIPATELGAELGGRLASLGPRISQAAGATPRGEAGFRPTISSDAGWAGPNSVGVFGGARVDNGVPQTARPDAPSMSQIRSLQRQRGYSPPGDSRGSRTSPLYDKFRAKGEAMAGKVRAMASNIRSGGSGGYSSGSSSGYSSSRYKTPNLPSEKRLERAWDRFNEDIENPKPLPVRGILKDLGANRYGAMSYLSNPEWLLTHPKGILGRPLKMGTVEHDQFLREPVTDVAMIMAGTQSKGPLTSKVKPIRPPRILKKQGVKPVKPEDKEDKRILDPSKVADEIAGVYRTMIAGQGFPTNETLISNLGSVKRNSALGRSLTKQYEEDPAAAVDSVRQYVKSAYLFGKPRDAFYDIAQRGIDTNMSNVGWQLAETKPKKFTQSVGRTVESIGTGAPSLSQPSRNRRPRRRR